MSGSRGPPQSGSRYGDYKDFEYSTSKGSRKKPFQQGRRDYTKQLPGSSSLTHSMGGGSNDSYGGGRRYGSGSGGSSRNSSGGYGSYGGGPGAASGGYNKPWRSSLQGDPKSIGGGGGGSGNAVALNPASSSYSPRLSANGSGGTGANSIPYQSLGSSVGVASGSANLSGRYDSYSTNASGRNSLSNSVGGASGSNSSGRPFGKRVSSYNGSSSAGVGGAEGAGEGKPGRGSDTYYPISRHNSLTQSVGGGAVKGHDRYPSKYRGGFKKGKRYEDESYDQRRDYYAYNQLQHPREDDRNFERLSYQKSRLIAELSKVQLKKENEEDAESAATKSDQSMPKEGTEQDKDTSKTERTKDEDHDDDDEDEDEYAYNTKDSSLADVDIHNNSDDDEEDQDDEDDEDDDDEEDETGYDNDDDVAMTDVHEEARKFDTTELMVKSEEKSATDTNIHTYTTSKTAVSDLDSDIKLEASDEGCIYPLNYMETQFVKLKQEFESKTKVEHDNTPSIHTKYTKDQVLDLQAYPFFSQNIGRFLDSKMDILTTLIRNRNKVYQRKKIGLIAQTQKFLKDWELKRDYMDQQLSVLHPPEDDMKRELSSIDIRVRYDDKKNGGLDDDASAGNGNGTSNYINNYTGNNVGVNESGNVGRRGRRHGDLVTTEAEFQEILQSLGKEQDEDPLFKAQRVSAKIPDFILDPVKRDIIKYMDSNNIVENKQKWSKRVHSDFHDTFSYEEHELFCEAFCMYPKRFGAISRHIGGLRTPEECVLHYYLTKKAVNYKLLVNQYKKKSSKKNSGGRRKTAKSRNPSLSNTPISTPTNEKALDLPIDSSDMGTTESSKDEKAAAAVVAELGATPNSKTVNEELFTETGRRKRAAAPVFKESNETGGEKKKQRRRKDEDESPTFSTQLQPPLQPQSEPQAQTQSHNDAIATAPIEVDAISDDANKVEVKAESSVLPAEEPSEVPAIAAPETKDENAVLQSENLENKDDQDDKKKTITSYWSITESNLFPLLLAEHGTKWTTIADRLSTKTATMVRNYFQRNYEKHKWADIVKVADARLDAKFAAVLGQDQPAGVAANSTEPAQVNVTQPVLETTPPTVTEAVTLSALPPATVSASYPQVYSFPAPQHAPILPPTQSHFQHPQGISLGTFQHGYGSAPFGQQLKPAFSASTGKSNISSLLLNDSDPYKPYVPISAPYPSQGATSAPAQQVQELAPKPPAKSVSIVSPPPQRSSIMSLLNSDSSPVKPEPQPSVAATAGVLSHAHSNSLKSLLNSPSNRD